MSNVARVAGQAANTLVKPLNVEDVFSTYLYDGTGSTAQSISNGIDLNGEGGLVWLKSRGGLYSNILYDTERGVNKYLRSNQTIAEGTALSGSGLTAFNSDGFDIGSDWAGENVNYNIASWTFRKHPDFFNVVEYTGDGTNARDLPHGLNKKTGFIVVKRTDSTGDWVCSHRSSSIGELNSTAAFTGSTTTGTPGENGYAILNAFSNDTTVRIANGVGGLSNANANGASYVAYIWAHNDGDGTFGPDADQDIIKCGSYTGNGSTTGPTVDLGFEPQWLLVKNASASANWTLLDVMRGLPVSGSNQHTLLADSTAAELVNTSYQIQPLSDGFQPTSTNGLVNASGNTYIYIAIRRPTAVPESATEVFDVLTSSSSSALLTSDTVTTDALLHSKRSTSAAFRMHSRLTGQRGLSTYSTAAESDYSTYLQTDEQTGFELTGFWATNPAVYYSWKRAPNFFDVVAYTGDGVAGRTVSHNLGVAPEMIWVKQRNAAASWRVYHSAIGNTGGLTLNLTNASFTLSTIWNNTSPTATDFTLGTYGEVNTSGNTYIAYLFASLDGVSKLGSYTGDGTTGRVIDCGFSSGARFVLIKPTSQTGGWSVYDTERGIVAGSDPVLYLNSTTAESSPEDDIDPHNSGFILNHKALGNFLNGSGVDYIFYAIA